MTDFGYWDAPGCGCMLGLAFGEALGTPVKFSTRAEIVALYGPEGIQDLASGAHTGYGRMAIATARAVLDWRADLAWVNNAVGSEADFDALAMAMWARYVEWSHSPACRKGSLGAQVSASLHGGVPSTLSDPVNHDARGCGGVTRVAPLGLVGLGLRAFEAGARCATLTHRHPTSDTAAGFLAQTIQHLTEHKELDEAVGCAREELVRWDRHEATLEAVDTAVRLAAEPGDTYRAIAQIGHVGVEEPTAHGKGWVAEECLGIALYCALLYRDNFAAAVRAAVNIGGDSASTGSVTGPILGAALGVEAIPRKWRQDVANRAEFVDLGAQLAAIRDDHRACDNGVAPEEFGLTRRPVTTRDVDGLLSYLPWLETVERIVRESGVDPEQGGEVVSRALAAPPDRYDFSDYLYGNGWIVVFDWGLCSLGRRLYDNPESIANADLPTLRRLFTTIARADHMCGGEYHFAIARGFFASMVRRLGELREAGLAP